MYGISLECTQYSNEGWDPPPRGHSVPKVLLFHMEGTDKIMKKDLLFKLNKRWLGGSSVDPTNFFLVDIDSHRRRCWHVSSNRLAIHTYLKIFSGVTIGSPHLCMGGIVFIVHSGGNPSVRARLNIRVRKGARHSRTYMI